MNGKKSGPDRLRDKWNCDLGKLGKSWQSDLEDEIAKRVSGIVQEIFQPDKIIDFMKRAGFDFSWIEGSREGESGGDPYRVFGLERSASDREIKSRYRELLRKYHPDTSGKKGTEAEFHKVIEAYEAIKKERGWT